jgi:predicted RNase H-like nuclease
VSVVLGIDAAWTPGKPSGVALLRRRDRTWDCVALAPSYASFIGEPRVDWDVRPAPGPPDCDALIAACVRSAGAPPDVIAIDMPLATHPITARRAADNAIASAFGARGLGAHSPSPTRPGPLADTMRVGFGKHGYSIAGATTRAGTPRVLIEVFPHAAAIALARADYRVPYKLARIARYWPERSSAARRRAVLAQWRELQRALAARVRGATLRIPRAATLAALKRYEDALDALFCAWTGAEYLAGRVRPHGDATAAVWA